MKKTNYYHFEKTFKELFDANDEQYDISLENGLLQMKIYKNCFSNSNLIEKENFCYLKDDAYVMINCHFNIIFL